MDNLSAELTELRTALDQALAKLSIDKKSAELAELTAKMAEPDFWQDNQAAQVTATRQAQLAQAIEPWQELQAELDELQSFIELKDDSLRADIETRLASLRSRLDERRRELRFSGRFDDHDA